MFKLTVGPTPIGVKFRDISDTLKTFILSDLDLSIVQFNGTNIYTSIACGKASLTSYLSNSLVK